MKILVTSQEIRDAVSVIQPEQIAVAYVGSAWSRFVKATHLREIIVSPTLGSNPKAIEELMNFIGDENVYFLDKLHSKIYLGITAAVIGSCNLSDNAMGGDGGLLECAVLLDERGSLKTLQNTFMEYKDAAKNNYPNREAKIERLKVLQKQTDRLSWSNSIVSHDNFSPALADYKSELDTIHIVPYQGQGIKLNVDVLGTVVPNAQQNPDAYFADYLDFLEEDKITPGDWILAWHQNTDGAPRVNGRIEWLYVHHVVSNGVIDDTYRKLVGQSRNLNTPKQPFSLELQTKNIIREALNSRNFPELLQREANRWELAPADNRAKEFIQQIKIMAQAGWSHE